MLSKSKEMLTVIWNKKIRDICSESKGDSYRRAINPFSNEMDKIKLYNITWGTYTSYDISECLLTIFERGKIRMVEFKERVEMHPISIFSDKKRKME